MVIFGSKLTDIPIISLSSGGPIATSSHPVIDWTALRIVALQVTNGSKDDLVLRTQDIREYSADLILVNSEDDLTSSDDIIRLQPLLKQNFRLIGARVKSESGHAMGNVTDYTYDPKSFVIHQLYVKQPLYKSFMTDSLVIDRSQIIDVSPPNITVRDASVKGPVVAVKPVISE